MTKVRLLRGTVLSPAGVPLENALIRVIYYAPPPARSEVVTTYQWESGDLRTDPLGNFVIAIHPERVFAVEASHPQFLPALSVPMTVSPGHELPIVRLKLGIGVSVMGQVRDETGEPIQGARVALLEHNASPNLISFEILKSKALYSVTSSDGRFKFDQVKPAEKTLVVTHRTYKPLKQIVTVGPSQQPLELSVTLRSRP